MKFKSVWLLPLFLYCITLCACAETVKPKPNILLILLDDLGVNDLSLNNQGLSSTPNIDQLAQQGIYFTRHYTDSTCGPSRAALLTGMRPSKLGFTPTGLGLSAELTTLPEFLKNQGYQTAHIGKWHLGHRKREAWPSHQGFDYWFGFLHQFELSGPRAEGETGYKRPSYYNPWLRGSEESYRQHKGHLNDILSTSAIKQISRMENDGAPWFLNLWFYAPHTPIQPDAKYVEGATGQAKYQALLKQLDHNIGQIIKHLDEHNMRENTVIIIASDNGGTDRHFPNNTPFKGKKAQYQEGGIRTPLILAAAVTMDVDQNKPVALIDIYPTIAEIIGEQAQGLDGRSILSSEISRQHWILEYPLGSSFSWLSEDGSARLTEFGEFHYQNTLPTLELLKPEQIAPSVEYKKFREQLIQDRTLHLSTAKSEGDAYIHITGDRFRRISGYGGLNVSLALTPKHTNEQVIIMEQPGHWRLSQLGLELTLEAYDQKVKTALNESECQLISLSFYLGRSDLRPDLEKGWVGLFKNKKPVNKLDLKSPDIETLNFEAPTQVLNKKFYPGEISQAFFYKKALQEAGWPDNLDIVPELCN